MAPNHYLNQCWIIVNWTLRNKLQWNLNRNSNIFIQENAFESVVCETASNLSRSQCVNVCNQLVTVLNIIMNVALYNGRRNSVLNVPWQNVAYLSWCNYLLKYLDVGNSWWQKAVLAGWFPIFRILCLFQVPDRYLELQCNLHGPQQHADVCKICDCY